MDDDVDLPLGWVRGLEEDVAAPPPGWRPCRVASEVPLPAGRPTDWERNVAGLAGAAGSRPTWRSAGRRWRRWAASTSSSPGPTGRTPTWPCASSTPAGSCIGGLPPAPRAAGAVVGERAGPANLGDDILLARLHGRDWRDRLGAAPGRSAAAQPPALGVAAVAAAVAGHRRLATAGAGVGGFHGPVHLAAGGARAPHGSEAAAMLATSAAIPGGGVVALLRRSAGGASPEHDGRPRRSDRVLRALPGLGDLLCAVPALRAVRTAHPQARITLLGLPAAGWFVDRFRHLVDDLLVVEGVTGIPEVAPDGPAAARFLPAANARRFDLALQLHGSGVTSKRGRPAARRPAAGGARRHPRLPGPPAGGPPDAGRGGRRRCPPAGTTSSCPCPPPSGRGSDWSLAMGPWPACTPGRPR